MPLALDAPSGAGGDAEAPQSGPSFPLLPPPSIRTVVSGKAVLPLGDQQQQSASGSRQQQQLLEDAVRNAPRPLNTANEGLLWDAVAWQIDRHCHANPAARVIVQLGGQADDDVIQLLPPAAAAAAAAAAATSSDPPASSEHPATGRYIQPSAPSALAAGDALEPADQEDSWAGLLGSADLNGMLSPADLHGMPGPADLLGMLGPADLHGMPGFADLHGMPGSADLDPHVFDDGIDLDAFLGDLPPESAAPDLPARGAEMPLRELLEKVELLPLPEAGALVEASASLDAAVRFVLEGNDGTASQRGGAAMPAPAGRKRGRGDSEPGRGGEQPAGGRQQGDATGPGYKRARHSRH